MLRGRGERSGGEERDLAGSLNIRKGWARDSSFQKLWKTGRDGSGCQGGHGSGVPVASSHLRSCVQIVTLDRTRIFLFLLSTRRESSRQGEGKRKRREGLFFFFPLVWIFTYRTKKFSSSLRYRSQLVVPSPQAPVQDNTITKLSFITYKSIARGTC